jgi:uncharacterized membrane protein
MEETRVPRENHRHFSKWVTNFITLCCIEHTSPWAEFELSTLVMMGTDCTGSCKSNYHTITTTTASTNYDVLFATFICIILLITLILLYRKSFSNFKQHIGNYRIQRIKITKCISVFNCNWIGRVYYSYCLVLFSGSKSIEHQC